jgi:hypothetical protein
MGLPVILFVDIHQTGSHAVTLVGYSLRDVLHAQEEVFPSQASIPLRGLRIDKFYGHDDQFGPYVRMAVAAGARYTEKDFPITFTGSWKDDTGAELKLYPKVVVIPVYHKIRLTFLDVLQWLTRFHELLEIVLPDSGPGHVEWDAHLITTNEYKKRIKHEATLPKGLLESLLLLQHPRFIWYAGLWVEGVLVLELLIDATDMARSFPIYRATWRDAAVYGAIHPQLMDTNNEVWLAEILLPTFLELLRQADAP